MIKKLCFTLTLLLTLLFAVTTEAGQLKFYDKTYVLPDGIPTDFMTWPGNILLSAQLNENLGNGLIIVELASPDYKYFILLAVYVEESGKYLLGLNCSYFPKAPDTYLESTTIMTDNIELIMNDDDQGKLTVIKDTMETDADVKSFIERRKSRLLFEMIEPKKNWKENNKERSNE